MNTVKPQMNINGSGSFKKNISEGSMLTKHQPYNYRNVIMDAMAPQITGPTIVYSTVCSGADQRKP